MIAAGEASKRDCRSRSAISFAQASYFFHQLIPVPTWHADIGDDAIRLSGLKTFKSFG